LHQDAKSYNQNYTFSAFVPCGKTKENGKVKAKKHLGQHFKG
jgi:hypothetical protein